MKSKVFIALVFACITSTALDLPGLTPAEFVVVVSMDGLSPTAVKTAKAPFMKAWVKGGVTAQDANAVIPAITLTNHASMISGVSPMKHKMVVNFEFCQEMKVPSLYDLAQRSKLKTAMISAKAKFDCLVNESKLDAFTILDDQPADDIATEALRVFAEVAPNFSLVHFGDVDWTGHEYGWYSPEQIAAVEQVDAAFKKLVEGIQDNPKMRGRTTIILTADHGGHDKGHLANAEDIIIPWHAVGPGIPAGSVITDYVSADDTAAMAAGFLGLRVPREWDWSGQVHEIVREL